MRRMAFALVLNIVVLLLVIGATAIAVGVAIRTSDDIQTLLLNGKTSTAKSAKKTAEEVKLLLTQQAFDHRQTQTGQQVIRRAIRAIEVHEDATIRAAISQAAVTVGKELGK